MDDVYISDTPPLDVLNPGELTALWKVICAYRTEQGGHIVVEGPQGPALGLTEGLHQLGMSLIATDVLCAGTTPMVRWLE